MIERLHANNDDYGLRRFDQGFSTHRPTYRIPARHVGGRYHDRTLFEMNIDATLTMSIDADWWDNESP